MKVTLAVFGGLSPGPPFFFDEVLHVLRLDLPQQMRLELDMQIILGEHRGRTDELLGTGVRRHRNVAHFEHPAKPCRSRSGLESVESRGHRVRMLGNVADVARRRRRIRTSDYPNGN